MQKEAKEQEFEAVPVRDKVLRLFTYLKSLCELRTTQVRTVMS